METRWLTEDERQAWRNVSLMHLQLTAFLGRELAGDGLSLQDYSVLAHLGEQVDRRLRLAELGRQLGWEKSRVSHHITRMEQRGLVARVKCPTDGRGAFVEITESGQRAIEAAAPGHVEVVRRHFIDLLTVEQLGTLDEVARRVLAGLPE